MKTGRAAPPGAGRVGAHGRNTLFAVILGASLAPMVGAQVSQRPVYRGGADVILVDVQVVTGSGDPVAGLKANDFQVEVGGDQRHVVQADMVRYDAALSPPAVDAYRTPTAVTPAPDAPRRLFVLAVDESSFSALAAMAWKEAIKRFIERLTPADFVGLYAYPVGGPLVQLTQDRVAVLGAADTIVGRLDPPMLQYNMSLDEMLDITRGDRQVTERVARRECEQFDIVRCITRDLPDEARRFAREVELKVAQSIGGLRTLMRSLAELKERKTVVVISGGLFAADRVGARGDVSDLISAVGHEAARANVNLYVLHLDSSFLEMFSPRVRTLPTMVRDGELLGLGLDRFAGIAGGELIRVQAGTGDSAFERVLRETSAYYLLAVEAAPEDRDGRPRRIGVKVNARGAVVRSRGWVVLPKPSGTEPVEARHH